MVVVGVISSASGGIEAAPFCDCFEKGRLAAAVLARKEGNEAVEREMQPIAQIGQRKGEFFFPPLRPVSEQRPWSGTASNLPQQKVGGAEVASDTLHHLARSKGGHGFNWLYFN